MTAESPDSPVAGAVRSLEVRWIFPGQLEPAVARWFGRFPAGTESREDTYLLDPQLGGLSVKIRGGGALEVKAYRGSPGILQVAGRARGRLESWQKWSFPVSPLRPDSGRPPGWRPVRKRRRITRFSLASGQIVARSPAVRQQPGCVWNSPRSTRMARTGGPLVSRRPDSPACCTAHSRPPPRSCSPRPCPVVWNPASMTPGPTRSGWASGRTPTATPALEDCPCAERAGPPFCPATPGSSPTGNTRGGITAARIILRLSGCQAGAASAWPKPRTIGQLAGLAAHRTSESGRPRHEGRGGPLRVITHATSAAEHPPAEPSLRWAARREQG